jgi:sigma-B regulation protein RsbU (phosphoserine phosphatase)
MGFLDPVTHSVNYHSGGQGPILHFGAADESFSWYKPTNFPVGIMEIDDQQQSANLQLAPGDILALISDGVYEYNNTKGEEFGESGVAEVFRVHHRLPMSELTQQLIQAVKKFAGTAPQEDDITLVLVRREPESS